MVPWNSCAIVDLTIPLSWAFCFSLSLCWWWPTCPQLSGATLTHSPGSISHCSPDMLPGCLNSASNLKWTHFPNQLGHLLSLLMPVGPSSSIHPRLGALAPSASPWALPLHTSSALPVHPHCPPPVSPTGHFCRPPHSAGALPPSWANALISRFSASSLTFLPVNSEMSDLWTSGSRLIITPCTIPEPLVLPYVLDPWDYQPFDPHMLPLPCSPASPKLTLCSSPSMLYLGPKLATSVLLLLRPSLFERPPLSSWPSPLQPAALAPSTAHISLTPPLTCSVQSSLSCLQPPAALHTCVLHGSAPFHPFYVYLPFS